MIEPSKERVVFYMNILQTTDLKKYYGTEPNITKALDGVTLSIEDVYKRQQFITPVCSVPGGMAWKKALSLMMHWTIKNTKGI